MNILLLVLGILYIPLQFAFLVGGIYLIAKSNKSWGKIIGGIICLMLFTLMLPFTRIVAGLLHLLATGQGFGA